MQMLFSPAWCPQVIRGKPCDKQIGKHFLFHIFQLAKPLVEQHEKFSFHDRSNLAIVAASSLETIFPASSHTLQVLLCNRHLFIISPQISSFDQQYILIFSCLTCWSRFCCAHIYLQNIVNCWYSFNLNANKRAKTACLRSSFVDGLINSSIALPAETINTLFGALCHNPRPPTPTPMMNTIITAMWRLSGAFLAPWQPPTCLDWWYCF